MQINDLVISTKETVGDEFVLVSIKPAYEYVDGRRTEEFSAYKYSVVCVKAGYEKIAVRVEGDKKLSDDAIDQNVIFENLELKPYIVNGRFGLSAKATGIKKATTSKS